MFRNNISIKFLFISAVFISVSFVSLNFVFAQEILNQLDLPGAIEGTGVYFEITDSDYLNITLSSSEAIKLRMESAPEMITMMIEPASAAVSTQITLSGFTSLTTYYKYQDDYHNLVEFISDENGRYFYTQDVTESHLVFIQPRKSTKFIKDDATGGDCALIGVWDYETKTCILTSDVYETIQIDSNGIILDGNGHTIIGVNTGYGVYLSNKTSITLKNLKVENFVTGIFLYASRGNTVTDNLIFNNSQGIYLSRYSNNNIVKNNNTYLNSFHGVVIDSSSGNTLTNNIAQNNAWLGFSFTYADFTTMTGNISELNGYYGVSFQNSSYNNLKYNTMLNNRYNFYLSGWKDDHYNQNIDISNLVGGKPIYYLKNINGQVYDESTNAGVFYLINSNNIIIKNLEFAENGAGIFLWKAQNIKGENIRIINNWVGIYQKSGSLTLFNSDIGNQSYGILIEGGTTTLSQNSMHNNLYYGTYNSTTTVINAENNWWGSISGPYHATLNPSGIGNAVSNNVDFIPWLASDPFQQNQPPIFSNLNQYKSDFVTLIQESGITQEFTVVFKAALSDPDNDQIKFQIELKEYGQSFNGQNLVESGFVNSGSEAMIIRNNLTEGQYHWQARAVDSQGNSSQWQEFGTAGNVDFEVQLPLNVKAANLAKELVNHPEGYLWGGKGWDFNINKFIASTSILSGYTYWNPNRDGLNNGGFDIGIGVDCSGLITWAFNRAHDALAPAVDNFVKYINANGLFSDYQSDAVTEAELLPGDVMFFDWGKFDESTEKWDGIKDGYMDHVAMYVGESGGYDVVNALNPRVGIIKSLKNELRQSSGFITFKRVALAFSPAILATAYSPVDLILTDPDGFTITPITTISSDLEYLREIPGELYYSEMEKGTDGNPIDQIYSYVAKTGDYIIKVIPATGALSTETYTLDFKVGEQTIILAQDTLLSQIPNQGYGVAVSAAGTVNSFIPVIIDIKPDSYPNTINLGSNGVVPVAIFGSATFDVMQIDPITINLANASAKLKGNGQPIISYSDMNSDGFTDLTVNVTTEALQLTENDIAANLEGRLVRGEIIKGSDSIRIVP